MEKTNKSDVVQMKAFVTIILGIIFARIIDWYITPINAQLSSLLIMASTSAIISTLIDFAPEWEHGGNLWKYAGKAAFAYLFFFSFMIIFPIWGGNWNFILDITIGMTLGFAWILFRKYFKYRQGKINIGKKKNN
ncbi:hypothetical protein HY989_04580 [Candidatus Micrarchaeota archaeon]|nr:hypothetical protein [Candidatus Micrarchaeota archaeon]